MNDFTTFDRTLPADERETSLLQTESGTDWIAWISSPTTVRLLIRRGWTPESIGESYAMFLLPAQAITIRSARVGEAPKPGSERGRLGGSEISLSRLDSSREWEALVTSSKAFNLLRRRGHVPTLYDDRCAEFVLANRAVTFRSREAVEARGRARNLPNVGREAA